MKEDRIWLPNPFLYSQVFQSSINPELFIAYIVADPRQIEDATSECGQCRLRGSDIERDGFECTGVARELESAEAIMDGEVGIGKFTAHARCMWIYNAERK